MSTSYRHFTFTAYTTVRPVMMDWMSYIISGSEICPDTGRHHWQGHFYTKKKITLKTAIKRFKPHHVEVSVDPEASREYCKKDGDYFEDGTWPDQQGKRNDLKRMIDDILEEKTTIDEILVHSPMAIHQYGRTLEKARELVLKRRKRDFVPICHWLWGPTGVGKTRSVVEANRDLYFFPYEKNGWWDNYEGQEAVLFDDFRGQLPLNEVLRICDRYDYTVPRRGKAPIPLMAKRFYFTSCKRPEEVFKDNEAIEQLLRRITVEYIDGLSLQSNN